MITFSGTDEDRASADADGQSIESRLAAELADAAVLSGTTLVVVVEFPTSDRPGRVIMATPDRAPQWFDHKPYAHAAERVPIPAPAELITRTGAALD